MAFSRDFLDDLVAKTDIVELVSDYVRLSKRSGSNFFGLCPFHGEKTPSFSVNPDKQFFHCFGCGKGGGAINFIMEIEGLPFTDAVEHLARKVGVSIPEDGVSDDVSLRRKRMLDLNRDAARFFYAQLSAPSGGAARQYVSARGLNSAVVTRFGIGAAPDSWDSLSKAMTAKGYTEQELISAGLARKRQKGDGVYDLFRNRLVFPVIDIRGSVIGFSGRILGDGEPKYLNSPDTLVFNKSRNIFGLNLAKKSKAGALILAEGNIDVVMLHQAGFDNAVATLGTSLTAEQVQLISRYVNKVILAYDSDSAGQKASQRAVSLLEKTGMEVRVLRFENAKDPDEFIKKYGPDSFSLLIERSEGHIEFKISIIKSRHDLGTDTGRLGFLGEATEMLSEVENAAEREIYSTRVAGMAAVSKEAVLNEIRKLEKIKRSRQKKQQERNVTRPLASVQPAERSMRYQNERSAVAEEGLIRCLIQEPELIKRLGKAGFSKDEFTSEFLARIFELLKSRFDAGQDTGIAVLSLELSPSEAAHLSGIVTKPESLPGSETAVVDYIEKIRAEKMKTEGQSDIEKLMKYKQYREKKDIGG